MPVLSTKVRRTMKAGLALGLPVGSLVMGAPAAQAGTCGDSLNASAGGNRASWQVACSNGNVSAIGSVTDGHADGLCARVKFYFPATGRWKYSARACPQGETQRFNIGDQGYVVNGYLYEEN